MIEKLPLQLQCLAHWVQARYDKATSDETGASTIEWVIIVAILAALAIAVGVIIVNKVTTKANNINLGN
jgi:Flp pilus assembly pilin Flp